MSPDPTRPPGTGGSPDTSGSDDTDEAEASEHRFDDDPRVQAGLDHLQRAALEVIAASRALLDVAEELVDDPRGAGNLLGLFSTLGDVASRLARPPLGRRGHDDDDDDDDDEGPPVQRIPVS